MNGPGEGLPRCAWARGADPLTLAYHDGEWGQPSRDDRHLFEMLILEGFQAGLSWRTILWKREAFRRAFDGFDPARVAGYGDTTIDALMADPGIVRNRLKIRATVRNARAFLQIQRDCGSFSDYLWNWVGGEPLVLQTERMPVRTELSDRLSADLRRRGMAFVGAIVYSFL